MSELFEASDAPVESPSDAVLGLALDAGGLDQSASDRRGR